MSRHTVPKLEVYKYALQGVNATKSMVRKGRRYTTATCKDAVIERRWEE